MLRKIAIPQIRVLLFVSRVVIVFFVALVTSRPPVVSSWRTPGPRGRLFCYRLFGSARCWDDCAFERRQSLVDFPELDLHPS